MSSLLTLTIFWVAISCIGTPVVGAMLSRSLDVRDASTRKAESPNRTKLQGSRR